MHGYLSNGHPNSLSNFTYKKVEKVASLRPLLDQPWIMTKIIANIVKVGVNFYVPNSKINLWSNFNSKKLFKRETLLYGFADIGIKGNEIFWNVSKFCVHYQMGIQIYDEVSTIRNCSKVKIRHAF